MGDNIDVNTSFESLLKGRKPTPIALREDCWFCAPRKKWVPEKHIAKLTSSERKGTHKVRLVLQEAPTEQAKCRLCGVKIAKKSIRLGYPLSDPRGDYGVLVAWSHIWPCARRIFDLTFPIEEVREIVQKFREVEVPTEPESKDPVRAAHSTETAATEPKPCSGNSTSSYDEKTQRFADSNIASSVKPYLDKKLLQPAIYDHELLPLEDKEHVINHLYGHIANEAPKSEEEEATEEIVEALVRRQLHIRARPPSHLMTAKLLRFQEEGLAWMLAQERTCKGGILADEMGMGKTIQTIALLISLKHGNVEMIDDLTGKAIDEQHSQVNGDDLTRKASDEQHPQVDGSTPAMSNNQSKMKKEKTEATCEIDDTNADEFAEARGGTLVIAPLAAVTQWKTEIEKFTAPGALSVLIYYGSKREALIKHLGEYDVVIASYATIESDYRRVLNVHKTVCKYCGRLFLPDKLQVHLRYYCGPAASRTAGQAKTEKKTQQTAKKAMQTLGIGAGDDEIAGPPTITNVYKSIMKEANRANEAASAILSRVPWFRRHRRERAVDPAGNEDVEMSPAPLTASDIVTPGSDEEVELVKATVQGPKRKKCKVDNGRALLADIPKADLIAEGIPDELFGDFLRLINEGHEATVAHAAILATGNYVGAKDFLTPAIATEVGTAVTEADTKRTQTADHPFSGDNGVEKCFEGKNTVLEDTRIADALEWRRKLGLSKTDIAKKKVDELQRLMRLCGLTTFGRKIELVNRLSLFLFPDDENLDLMGVAPDGGIAMIPISGGDNGDGRKRTTRRNSAASAASNSTKKTITRRTDSSEKPGCDADTVIANEGQQLPNIDVALFDDDHRDTKAIVTKNDNETQGKDEFEGKTRRGSASSQKCSRRNSAVFNSQKVPSVTTRRSSRILAATMTGTNAPKSDAIQNTVVKQENEIMQNARRGPITRRQSVDRTLKEEDAKRRSSVVSRNDPTSDSDSLEPSESSSQSFQPSSDGYSSLFSEPDSSSSHPGSVHPEEQITYSRKVGSSKEFCGDSTPEPVVATKSHKRKKPATPLEAKIEKRVNNAKRKLTAPIDDSQSTTSLDPQSEKSGKKKAGGKTAGGEKAKKPNKRKVGDKGNEGEPELDDIDAIEGAYGDTLVTSDEDEGVDIALSPLHAVRWTRVLLDEAHRIKGRTTSTAKAIYALKASTAKWCLTGTPLQNRIGELYSLVRFLRFAPFAFYFCSKKGCTCRSLHYRFVDNKFCVKCGHSRLSHYSYFNRRVVTPIQRYGYEGEGRMAMKCLKEEVLDQLLLRRTKVERAADVQLPPLTVLIRRDELAPAERDFYESLYKVTRTQFDTYVASGTLLHNFAHIFDLLSRLRQACNHPYLIVYGALAHPEDPMQNAVIPAPGRGDAEVCGLCQDDVDHQSDLIVSSCKHCFHRECISEYLATAPESAPLGCPVCYTPLSINLNSLNASPSPPSSDLDVSAPLSRVSSAVETDTATETASDMGSATDDKFFGSSKSGPKAYRSGILSRIKTSEFKSSTKLEALIEELSAIEEDDEKRKEALQNNVATNPEQDAPPFTPSKSIVFSQYTAMLELIEWRLKKAGIHCAKMTGALSLTARTNVLLAFNQDPQLRVILISLKAGGEGLNLQVANNIFLMDPWWNPAAEMQAIQRAHRIGQTRPVRAVRFITEGTIEEKILQLQEKKQLVFDGTVGSSSTALAKLTQEDLRFLFNT